MKHLIPLAVLLTQLSALQENMAFLEGLAVGAGYVPVMETLVRTGISGQVDRWYLQVPRAREYFIAAIGDDFCRDLDLRVYDEYGRVLGEDRENDPYPMVRVVWPNQRRLIVDVVMVDCRGRTCDYGLRVFSR